MGSGWRMKASKELHQATRSLFSSHTPMSLSLSLSLWVITITAGLPLTSVPHRIFSFWIFDDCLSPGSLYSPLSPFTRQSSRSPCSPFTLWTDRPFSSQMEVCVAESPDLCWVRGCCINFLLLLPFSCSRLFVHVLSFPSVLPLYCVLVLSLFISFPGIYWATGNCLPTWPPPMRTFHPTIHPSRIQIMQCPHPILLEMSINIWLDPQSSLQKIPYLLEQNNQIVEIRKKIIIMRWEAIAQE